MLHVLAVAVVLGILAYFLPRARKARRYKKVSKIRDARHEERMFGEHFLALARERQQEIRCWVIPKHRRWGDGYKVRLECLGEPDILLSVVINFWLPKKKRIEIYQYPYRGYFSTDRESLDQATKEFETRLANLVPSSQPA